MKKPLLISLILSFLVLAGAELWLRSHLFDTASYSNSDSIDAQLKEFKSASDWDTVIFGDSEAHWGVDPRELDKAFEEGGLKLKSFNHAFDGFGISWWSAILPHMLEQPSFRNVKNIVLGVQLIDTYRIMHDSSEDCGDLQRPVLSSPFATDIGISSICGKKEWDADLVQRVFGNLWLFRYASAVRSLVFPQSLFGGNIKLNSATDGDAIHGFQPHFPISKNPKAFDEDFARWKAQYNPEKDFVSVPTEQWKALTDKDGFFDKINAIVKNADKRLVLFALPTNPLVIDTFNRRGDYARNSTLLREWASKNGVIYADLGIHDNVDRNSFFSDMRHLSGEGAKIYSRRLGLELVGNWGK